MPEPGRPRAPHCSLNRLVLHQEMPAHVVERPGTNDHFFAYFHQAGQIGSQLGVNRHPAHSWICWGADDRHVYGRDDSTWLHSCFHITGSKVEQLFSKLPQNTVGSIANPPAFHACLDMLYHNALAKAEQQLILSNLECLMQICLQKTKTSSDDEMITVKTFIDEHFKQALNLELIAEQFHMSASSLRARFKRAFKQSVIDYLIQRRLQHAHYLLHDQDMPIAEIAKQVGYDDSAYFSRLIKKQFGKSPRALRQAWSAN